MLFFFLMIRRPPRSTQRSSSAASDVYKRQALRADLERAGQVILAKHADLELVAGAEVIDARGPVSYTHLRAHATVLDLVCRLLLEKKNATIIATFVNPTRIHHDSTLPNIYTIHNYHPPIHNYF